MPKTDVTVLLKEYKSEKDEKKKREIFENICEAFLTNYELDVLLKGNNQDVATLLYTYRRMADIFQAKAEVIRDCALSLGFPGDEDILTKSGKNYVHIVTFETKLDSDRLEDMMRDNPIMAEKVNGVIESKRASINLGTLTIKDFQTYDRHTVDVLPLRTQTRNALKVYKTKTEAN